MTDKQILACYQRRDEHTPVAYLLRKSKWRKNVQQRVRFYGGTKEDYEEILDETIVAFNTGIITEKYRGEASLKTYFLRISENQCKKMLEKRESNRQKMENYVPIATAIRAEEIYGPDWQERYERLLPVIKQLGGKKRKLLELIMAGWQHKDIAPEIGLRDANSSKSTFNRIKNRIKAAIKLILLFFSLT